jgi:hypothetical protein
MAKVNQGNILKKVDIMLEGLGRNELEPGVTNLGLQLADARGVAKEALSRRALHDAQSQQASRDLDGAMVTVKALYSRVQRILQGSLGVRAEKLAEFGLQPLRPVPKSKPTETKPEQTQSAKQAATTAADSTT